MPIAGHEKEVFINSQFLTEEERIIYEWQHDKDGGFRHTLMSAISIADGDNLECLRKGFPVHVRAYERFAHERGWYEAVEHKMGGRP
jgi:hypothetical protein